MPPELTRPIDWRTVAAGDQTFAVRGTPAECEAVAARLNIPAVGSLECRFMLTHADAYSAEFQGDLRSTLTRTCVVSAEDFETAVETSFAIRFVVAGHEKQEFDIDDIDEIPFDGVTIDLGEAAVEQLALVLDPYPRMDGAELPEIEDPLSDSPFSALARRSVQ